MYDIAILNGVLIDTAKMRLTAANLYCKDGKICEISRETREAAKVINAAGCHVSPGFIDIHAHIEGTPHAGARLCQQGVTTSVNGNCGMGLENLTGFFEKMDKDGFIINQIELSGASTLRKKAGQLDRYAPMNGAQLDRAINLLKEELEAGAGGLSFGLEYMPGSSHEEVIAMSRVAARYDKLISIHIRSDRYQGLEALEEAFDISRICGAKVQISHVVYQFGFGMMHQAMDMINRAIDEGVDISCDSGMYTSFSTNIGTAVFDEGCVEKWHCSYDSLITPCGKYAGQKLSKESYEDLRKNFPDEVAIALVGNPDEIPLAFDLPSMMASSDAGVNASDKKVASHPQDTSAFPRFIRQMVVEQGRLTLLDAVSRITSIPAKRMGLAQKGILAEGNDADITIFDLKTMRDNAVFPHLGAMDALPDGIQAVLVNGTVAIENKKIINDKAGKILYFPNRNWQY